MAALEQTLTKNPLFFHPIKISHTTSHTRLFSLSTKKSKRLLYHNSRICCSYDYVSNSNSISGDNNGLYDGYGGPKYPRPTEVQWKKELSNSVQLIGIVATPVQIKHLASGKVLAWSRLAVKRSQNETLWINLTFWNELAHVASQHVEKGNQIYVAGRLVSDTIENGEGKQQTFYKVAVQQLNFVERGFSSVGTYDGESNSLTPGNEFPPVSLYLLGRASLLGTLLEISVIPVQEESKIILPEIILDQLRSYGKHSSLIQ